MRQPIHYRRLARAALNTAATTDEPTAAMLRLMAADYAAEADRLEAIENSNELHGDLRIESVPPSHSPGK
jgi:hypothetical protein